MPRWGRTDFRQLQRLKDKIDRLSEFDLDRLSEKTVKELAARMLAKVVRRTPTGEYPSGIGKTGGTLKRGWTVGNVTKTGDTYEIEIFNSVYYAPYVEFGHRTANHQGWVSGRFMMTISEQELEREAPRVIERALEQYLREVFRGDR